jgi:hypothetical protein
LTSRHRLGLLVAVHIRSRFDRRPPPSQHPPVLDHTGFRHGPSGSGGQLYPSRISLPRTDRCLSRSTGGLALLRNYHVSNITRMACVWAYPNPAHPWRINILGIVPPSNHNMPTVALTTGQCKGRRNCLSLLPAHLYHADISSRVPPACRGVGANHPHWGLSYISLI